MRILYYTSGLTGSGHVVRGISIGLGIRRLDPSIEYKIAGPSTIFGALCGRVGIQHADLPLENEYQLFGSRFSSSALFEEIASWHPDILIVDMFWFNLHSMISSLPCKKIFLSRQVHEKFFEILLPDATLTFNPESWDMLVACEPWDAPFPMLRIDPIIIRNRNEILAKNDALKQLGVSGKKPVFLLTLNAHPGNFEKARENYSYLEKEGWDTVYSSNFHDGLFPAADCFEAVDLLACGGGYNSFWESVFFEKETVYMPQEARFEDARLRMRMGADYVFKENGADSLARLAMGL